MIRVLLVDDDPFIRESLTLILQLDGQLSVVGACEHGEEALHFLDQNGEVDVVLLDIRMPVCDGVEGTRLIKQRFPNTAVLVLTTFDDDDYIVAALQNGASGYLLKNISPDRIISGIKTVYQGDMLIHPGIARKLTELLHNRPKAPQPSTERLEGYGITTTEKAVIEKIAAGKANREIAQELFLSEGTVKNYVTDILSKLSLRDRTQIAIFYLTTIERQP